MTRERYEAHSPYLDAAKIRTPMLVIYHHVLGAEWQRPGLL